MTYRFSAYGVPGNLKAQAYLDDKLLATMTGLQDSEAIERWAKSVIRARELPKPNPNAYTWDERVVTGEKPYRHRKGQSPQTVVQTSGTPERNPQTKRRSSRKGPPR